MFKSNKSTKLFLIFLVAMFLFSDILTFAQSIDVNTTYNPESNEIINTRFENIQFIINTFLGSIAIIFAGLGLILWRKQLRGGDLYTYTKEALFELKKLLNFIEEFRYVFINENQENKIWLDIQNQYSIYESKIILLDILSNNKINDRINGKNIKDYLTIMYKSTYEKRNIISRQKKGEIMEQERKEVSEKLFSIDKILKSRNEIDDFGNELNEYFLLMCTRLKKYI